jgi:hypothetical protein
MTVLFVALISSAGTGQDLGAASENEQTRLSKDEITKLMIQVGRLAVPEQNSKMDRIWKDPFGSQTPRSDFLFCVGLAYLGNYKGQAYLGSAFENGRGIVRDSYESYVWYSIALDNPIDDEDAKQKIQKGRDRIKLALVSVYPAPSDQELKELVEAQKHRITEYLSEIRNTQP